MTFAQRIAALPRLGVGISCEFTGTERGAGIDAVALNQAWPELVHFLEVGADTARGLDEMMLRWGRSGLPATYHFLDLNLAELGDLDQPWLEQTLAQARAVGALWLCGDAGYWHLGPRERSHELLLPPILSREAAEEMAQAVRQLQTRAGMLVLPENPPAVAYIGPLHLLEFFALVCEQADCGMLLDCAHLAVYQKMCGHAPLAGLDDFPLERIVEIHVAGGAHRDHEGFGWVEDSHSPEVLPETWQITERIIDGASNLKAVVFEAEHNAPAEIHGGFERLNQLFPKGG
jgi:uncharacterized protein (UPF0276 family)